MDRILLGCGTGMAILCTASMSYFYMCIRNLRGTEGSYGQRTFERYRALVQEGSASIWPMRLVVFCAPLGIAIVFGSILLSK